MPRSENPKRFLGYWMVSRCNRCRWLVTPATAMVGFPICWKNRTSPRTSPSIPIRKPAWWPAAISSITATTWFAHRAKSCVGVRTTNGRDPTNTWRVRMIVRLAPSRTPASRRGKNGGTSGSPYINRSIQRPGSVTGPLPTGGRASVARASRKALSLPWTGWDGRSPDCVDYGRWTARAT